MPVRNGIGQSEDTLYKQGILAKVIEQHLAIVSTINWRAPAYQYIDITAGCGWNEIPDCRGSPLVFLDEVRKASVLYQAQFIEREEQNALLLREKVADHSRVICGNNEEVLPVIVRKLPPKSFGLVYCDPNGEPPFDLLAKISQLPTMRFMDILIHCSANYIKWFFQFRGRRLYDQLAFINKEYWIVQAPHGNKQWTFLLGLNKDCIEEMRHLGFYYLDDPKAQYIVEKLNLPRYEQKVPYQPRLFGKDN